MVGVGVAVTRELAGQSPATRSEFERLVLAAQPVIQEAEPRLRFRSYRTPDQTLPEDSPLALMVWESRTGADPFTDDVPRWHLLCGQFRVDLTTSSVVGSQMRCPRGAPDEPPLTDDATGPIDHRAPTGGTLFIGQRPTSDATVRRYRPTAPAHKAYPCYPEDLELVLEGYTSAGNTDDASLRAYNRSERACVVPGISRILNGAPLTTITSPGVALRPRESAIASVSWRPGPPTADRGPLQAEISHEPVRIHLGAGLPDGVMDTARTVSLGKWTALGYGASTEDRVISFDIAPPCLPEDLAVTSHSASSSGVRSGPQVIVSNLGTRACGLTTGEVRPAPKIPGLPALSSRPSTLLAPGHGAVVPVAAAQTGTTGQLLVAGRWVPVN